MSLSGDSNSLIDMVDCSDLTFESMAQRGNPLQTPLPPQVQQFDVGNSDSAEQSRTHARQSARRSKSERLQGTKPRVKRRDRNLPLDLAASARSTSGSLNDADSSANLRKAPSAGRLITSGVDLLSDTPDGSPHGLRRQGSNRPPLPLMTAAAATPDASPNSTRRGPSASSVAVTSTASNPSIARLTQQQRQWERSPAPRAKDGAHRRTGSVRGLATGGGSLTGTPTLATARRSAYLDVPDGSVDDDSAGADEDSYRLRSFDTTRKGVVNRGDSFRRRRSRSNSLAPQHLQQQLYELNTGVDGVRPYRPTPSSSVATSGTANAGAAGTGAGSVAEAPQVVTEDAEEATPPTTYRVAILGAHGVGMSALVGQFMTSECINAYERVRSEETKAEESVFVMLNGEESELIFTYVPNMKAEMNRSQLPDAYVVLYSVIDKTSFQKIEDDLARLQKWDALRGRALIVVGNKIDLVRSRAVSTQDGKCLACAYRGKFMEISVVINHNVDELLVGILTQIRLKEELQREIAHGNITIDDTASGQNASASWLRNKGLVRATMKAKQMFSWFFGKDDDQFNNCENFQVL